jgi:hypothetical protein
MEMKMQKCLDLSWVWKLRALEKLKQEQPASMNPELQPHARERSTNCLVPLVWERQLVQWASLEEEWTMTACHEASLDEWTMSACHVA